jgi:hypothetical protein
LNALLINQKDRPLLCCFNSRIGIYVNGRRAAHFAIFPTYDGEFVAETSLRWTSRYSNGKTSSVDAVADRMPPITTVAKGGALRRLFR